MIRICTVGKKVLVMVSRRMKESFECNNNKHYDDDDDLSTAS